MLCPKRMCIIHQFRTFPDTELFDLFCLFRLAVLCRCLYFIFKFFYNLIAVQLFFRFDDLYFCFFCLADINFCWHKGTIFLYDFFCLVFITEFQTVLIQIQCDLCTDLIPVAIFHIEFAATVTFPVNRLCVFLIRQCIDRYLIGYHKCGIETKSEVTDDLILICLVLILFYEICRAGKSDLVDVFIYLFLCHTKTVINDLDRFFLWIEYNPDLVLISFRKLVLSHHFQLFQFCDRITTV